MQKRLKGWPDWLTKKVDQMTRLIGCQFRFTEVVQLCSQFHVVVEITLRVLSKKKSPEKKTWWNKICTISRTRKGFPIEHFTNSLLEDERCCFREEKHNGNEIMFANSLHRVVAFVERSDLYRPSHYSWDFHGEWYLSGSTARPT